MTEYRDFSEWDTERAPHILVTTITTVIFILRPQTHQLFCSLAGIQLVTGGT